MMTVLAMIHGSDATSELCGLVIALAFILGLIALLCVVVSESPAFRAVAGIAMIGLPLLVYTQLAAPLNRHAHAQQRREHARIVTAMQYCFPVERGYKVEPGDVHSDHSYITVQGERFKVEYDSNGGKIDSVNGQLSKPTKDCLKLHT